MKPAKTPRKSKADGSAKPLSHSAVVEAIRQGILSNELVPGQRLVEAELCELLGASRGTVRAALMDLVHEGLIERIANRGARVRVTSLEEALQIAEVRRVLEGLCVGRAAELISKDEARELRSIAKQMKECVAHGDTGGFADLTHKAFETYIRIANQPVAQEMLERLRARGTRHRYRLTYRPGRSKVALPFWLDIIEAICDRDPVAAREALQRHSENVQEAMKALAQERGPFAALASDADTAQES
jgi:DNA-binding GntR family transcriptional regulator